MRASEGNFTFKMLFSNNEKDISFQKWILKTIQ